MNSWQLHQTQGGEEPISWPPGNGVAEGVNKSLREGEDAVENTAKINDVHSENFKNNISVISNGYTEYGKIFLR